MKKNFKKRSSKRNSNKNRNQKSKMKLKTINIAHIGGTAPLLEFNPLTQRNTIACGYRFNVAINKDGILKTWGENTHHQLDGVPGEGWGGRTRARRHRDYIAVACGAIHSVALKNDGTIKCWGDNSKGQLDGAPGDNGYIAIACGLYHSVALTNNGTIKCWGFHQYGAGRPPEDAGYIAIACGSYHSVALKNDGTIKFWIAENPWRQDCEASMYSLASARVPTDSGYIMIACGSWHSIALKNDGTIKCWGDNQYNQLNGAPRDSGYIMIACGDYHSVALKHDGTIKCWGNNKNKQLDGYPRDGNFITISCGFSHSLALKDDGTIKSWGGKGGMSGMLTARVAHEGIPTDSDYIAIACGKCDEWIRRDSGMTQQDEMRVRREGAAELASPTRGCLHPPNSDYLNISHSLALKRDGTIKCWGRNFGHTLLRPRWYRDGGKYLGVPTDSNFMIEHSTRVVRYDLQQITADAVAPNQPGFVPLEERREQAQQLVQQERRGPALAYTDPPTQAQRPWWRAQQVAPVETNRQSSVWNVDVMSFYESIPRIGMWSGDAAVTIYIDRKNVFESLKTHINKDGSDFFNKGTYIKFLAEDGIDQGGVTREFFALLSKELLQKHYFQVYNDISSINAEAKDINDYYIIGQMFAYAIKSKNNINIKLNPIILDFLINSEPVEELDITKTEFSLLLRMFDTLSAENITKILKLINDEIKHKKRHHSNLDTLEKVIKIFNDYDTNILTNSPYSAYLTLNESDWSSMAKICLDEPSAICVLYDNSEDSIDIPFTKKDIYLLFMIKSLAFTQCIAEFYKFIEGFDSIIKLDKLKSLNIKQLNKLIVGDRSLNIDDFLGKLQIKEGWGTRRPSTKSSVVKDFIKEESKKKDDYLNKLLYLITASESLPVNGWDSFKGREFSIEFSDINSVNSHVCDGFKYVEIPKAVLEGTDEEIKENLNTVLSYDSVVASSQSTFCMAGGGIRNSVYKKN